MVKAQLMSAKHLQLMFFSLNKSRDREQWWSQVQIREVCLHKKLSCLWSWLKSQRLMGRFITHDNSHPTSGHKWAQSLGNFSPGSIDDGCQKRRAMWIWALVVTETCWERDTHTEEIEGQREETDREGHTQRETGRESRECETGGDRERGREGSYQNPGGGLSLGSQLSCSVPTLNPSFFTLMASVSFSPHKPTHPTGGRHPGSLHLILSSGGHWKKWHWSVGILGTIAVLSMQLDESSEKPEAVDIPNRQRLQSQLLWWNEIHLKWWRWWLPRRRETCTSMKELSEKNLGSRKRYWFHRHKNNVDGSIMISRGPGEIWLVALLR